MVFGGRFLPAVLAIFLLTFSSLAASWQASPFIQSVQNTPYNFQFLMEGMETVQSVRFNQAMKTEWRPFLNQFVLGMDLNDGATRIKKLEDLSPEDVGTLAHEAFHSFKANVISVEPRYEAMKLWMRTRSQVLFSDLPFRRRETALEEAYGVFIGGIVAAHVNASRALMEVPAEKCSSRRKLFERVWDLEWGAAVNGYYREDGFSNYWSDFFKSRWVYYTQGKKAYDQYISRDPTTYLDHGITKIDKQWITENLFENRFFTSFEKTFDSQIELSECRQNT